MSTLTESLRVATTRRDPLRRMAPTPLVVDLAIMGRTIRLETNSPTILDRMRNLLARYEQMPGNPAEFHWKLVSNSNFEVCAPWPEISAFSDEDLRLVSFGQHSFLAIDLVARDAVGLLAEGLLADEAGFVSPFLTTLFMMTAASLRLTPVAGACVTCGDKALLVLGMPNNGKTTSSYLAAKGGLEFYSDRALFLDRESGRLSVWGDFAPASFRAETCDYLPQLRNLANPFQYRNLTLLYVEEGTAIRANGRPVVPACCVFLERGQSSTPELTPLSRREFTERLRMSRSFQDNQRFEAQQSAALMALARVPAYRLAYGLDPADAAEIFPELLQDSLQTNRALADICQHGTRQRPC